MINSFCDIIAIKCLALTVHNLRPRRSLFDSNARHGRLLHCTARDVTVCHVQHWQTTFVCSLYNYVYHDCVNVELWYTRVCVLL